MTNPEFAANGTCASCAVSRRSFLGAATVAAVAAVLEACQTSSLTGPGAATGSGGPLTVTLANYPALSAIGGVAGVDGGHGSPTALVRTAADEFVAVSMVCTHQGSTIAITSAGYTCPNHGAMFSKTGSWAGGQPTTPLYQFPTSYDAQFGTVTITRPG
ncbi:MAG TPA: Rieske 2Fe-2S domain-containing protein [Gemmatimonadaceae bacterium]|nr:Rieske 2Fe-2S domain-containing protein [Gemmatimonadaceae bacterium]